MSEDSTIHLSDVPFLTCTERDVMCYAYKKHMQPRNLRSYGPLNRVGQVASVMENQILVVYVSW